MHTDPKLSTLNDFLTALRFEGIPIGLHELIWLQHAFALEPELDRHHLKNLLACTLIKHLSQSETFDTLFDDWCPPEPIHVAQPTRASEKTEQIPTADHTFEEPFPQDQQPPSSTPTIEQFRPAPKPKRVWTTWPVWSSLGVCFIIGALAYSFFFNQTAPISKDIPKQTVGTSSQSSNSDSQRHPLPSNPVEEFWTWVPQVEIPPPPLIDTFWLSTSLALLSLLTGAVLLWRYRRQKIIPALALPQTENHSCTRRCAPHWSPVVTPARPGDE